MDTFGRNFLLAIDPFSSLVDKHVIKDAIPVKNSNSAILIGGCVDNPNVFIFSDRSSKIVRNFRPPIKNIESGVHCQSFDVHRRRTVIIPTKIDIERDVTFIVILEKKTISNVNIW